MLKSLSSLYKEGFYLSRRDSSLITQLEIPTLMSFPGLAGESRGFIRKTEKLLERQDLRV
jgi:hypothetical protein